MTPKSKPGCHHCKHLCVDGYDGYYAGETSVELLCKKGHFEFTSPGHFGTWDNHMTLRDALSKGDECSDFELATQEDS